MDLRHNPLISHKTPKQIYDRVQYNSGFGPFEQAAVKALLSYDGVPASITQNVLRDVPGPFALQAEEISRRQAQFLETATDRQLVELILQRVITSSKHVDFDVWARRVDTAIHDALGVPEGTVLNQIDSGCGIMEMTTGVYAAYAAEQRSAPSPM